MSELLEFTYAELSLAAYADLSPTLDHDQYVAALQAPTVGFSAEQAERFASTYRVLGHQPNTGSGFSATVFERVDGVGSPILAIRGTEPTFNDFASDALIALFGTSKLQPQYGALTTYLQSLTQQGKRTGTFSIFEQPEERGVV